MLPALILVFGLVSWSYAAELPEQDYPYRLVLNQQGAEAQWKKVGEDSIEFLVTAPTTGWFGFGITPNGGMKGADMVIGWIDEQGKGHVEDRHAPDFIEPVLDQQQDWTLLDSSTADGKLVFRMQRKLATCDKDDLPLTEGSIRFMYASNPAKPAKTGEVYHLRKHVDGSKGVVTAFLFDDSPRTPEDAAPGEEVTSMQFRVTSHTLPTRDTYYQCEVMPFPDVASSDLHMIGFGPANAPGNEDLVHHTLLYLCTDKVTSDVPKKRAWDCDNDDKELTAMKCMVLFGGWAKGGKVLFFPKDVAFPVQKAIDSKTYLMLQLHYDNPTMTAGRKDDSGLELYFVRKPRPNTAGSFRFGYKGLDFTLAIPPTEPEWRIRTECPSECTKKRFPKDGMKVVATGLHTHLLGTKVYGRIVRDGKEVEPFDKDETYDSNYQNFKAHKNPPVIMPGDRVLVDCVYSSPRNITTFGGEATREEMCIIFGFYYPAVDFTMCLSGGNPSEVAEQFGYSKPLLNYSMYKDVETFIGTKYDWSPANRLKIRQFLEGKQEYICMGEDAMEANTSGVIPKIAPYEPFYVNEACKSPSNSADSVDAGGYILSAISMAVMFLKSLLGKLGIDLSQSEK